MLFIMHINKHFWIFKIEIEINFYVLLTYFSFCDKN